MYKWVKKEFFFFATLAFVFVATASVSSFLKNHLHKETALSSAARVFWPDNQVAIYPESPPESFFLAQKKRKEKSTPVIVQRQLPKKVSGYLPQAAIVRSYPRYKKTQKKQPFRKAAVNTGTVKHVGAATPTPKKTSIQKQDTLAIRAYDVHMKWVKQTLAEYRDTK